MVWTLTSRRFATFWLSNKMRQAGPIADLAAAMNEMLASDDPACWRVAGAIELWLRTGGDFAAAMGMAPGWHSAHRQRERDGALRELARTNFPDLCGRPLANAVWQLIAGYEARRWPSDRAAGHRPDGAAGLAHDVLNSGPAPSLPTVRKSLGYS